MKEFRALETYDVADKGLTVCVAIHSKEFLPCKNEVIQIDQNLYKVTGCELSLKRSYPTVKSSIVGLQVQKIVEKNHAMDRIS